MDDVNILRTILTVVSFLIFMGIVAWAWSGARRERFGEASRLPLEEDPRLEPRPAAERDVERGK